MNLFRTCVTRIGVGAVHLGSAPAPTVVSVARPPEPGMSNIDHLPGEALEEGIRLSSPRVIASPPTVNPTGADAAASTAGLGAASRCPGPRREVERRTRQQLAAELPQLGSALGVETGHVAAGRADPEREWLPPFVEARMRDGH